MKLHLYWIDKRWGTERRTADNYNLLIDMENKAYKIFINPFYAYRRAKDVEVKRKSDILNYVEYLKQNGFTEEE